YKLRYVSNGQLFRQYAKEKGIALIEIHKMAEKDPSIDKEIDMRAIKEAEKGGVVIDGHLAVWILKDLAHLKIIFTAPLEVRASRVSSRDKKPIEEAIKELLAREKSNKMRAKKYYNIDVDDYSVADLMVNTEKLDVIGVKKVVKTFINEYKRLRPELF
ncbi:MAG TPA: cytidylate kinase, partial [Thermofilum sp.]|nr:cytidylate kinase [Thermofilum sp.]